MGGLHRNTLLCRRGCNHIWRGRGDSLCVAILPSLVVGVILEGRSVAGSYHLPMLSSLVEGVILEGGARLFRFNDTISCCGSYPGGKGEG